MSIQLDEVTEVVQVSNEQIFAHIIDRGDDKRSVHAIILEARVMGIPLTALCGYVWVPSRNPEQYPICEKCKEIFEFALDFRNGHKGEE